MNLEFWIGLFIFCLLCIFLERVLPNPINRIMPYILLGVLWFISAFRYNIGNDYSNYVNFFFMTNIDDLYPEFSCRWLIVFLRKNGFDYQMLFCIYSTLTYFILWLSIKKYIKDTSTRMIAITLYAITFSLMWYSFSIARQGLAMAIFLYALDYIYLRKLKQYSICILMATFVHTSSILLIPLYWLFCKNQKIRTYIAILIICLCVNSLNIFPNIIEFIIGLLGFSAYAGYLDVESTNNLFRLSLLFEVILFFICAYYSKFVIDKFLNIYAMYIYGLIVLSFSTVASRMNLFFEIAYIIVLAKTITYITQKYKNKVAYGVLIPIFILLLQCMYSDSINPIVKMQADLSAGNYQYEFNFRLIK